MKDKELKQLSRAELIDILYEQQKQLEETKALAEELQAKLNEKELHISTAGSIAEAAMKVNGVFEAAQAAANQYLLSIRAATSGVKEKADAVERQRQEILDAANAKAAKTVAEAEAKAKTILDNAERQSAQKWEQFEKRANEMIAAHTELQAIIGRSGKQ